MSDIALPASGSQPVPSHSALALRWSAAALVVSSWLSAAIFGVYILAFFGGTATQGAIPRWNESLPALHDAARPVATLSLGLHFAAGGILLLLGAVQLIGQIRLAAPAVHRWLGRLYVAAAVLAGFGGLGFIITKGTLGGTLMDAGFGLYGALMIAAAALAFTHARAAQIERHRAWAIRLFALTTGSWLYRLEYAFWFLVMGGAGHTQSFTGWFDAIMMFFFYLPNLAVAELFIRARRAPPGATLSLVATTALTVAASFVIVATWKFTTDYWAPGIVAGLTGAPL